MVLPLRRRWSISRADPDFEAARLLVADLPARQALHDISLGTLVRFMAHLVALEAELGVAVEAIVCVLAAKDAVWSAALVWALPRHVPKLLAVPTLYSRVRIRVVPSHAVLHTVEEVVLILHVVLLARLGYLAHLAVRRERFLLIWVDVAAEIHVAFDGAARYDQVWVALRVHRRDVVFAVITPSQGIPPVARSRHLRG